MKSNWWYKTQWYLLSMWLFAVIVLILTLHVPVCFEKDSHFVGFGRLWELNGVLPILAIVILILDAWFFFYELKYEEKGTMSLSKRLAAVGSRNGDALSFLASYFVPLVSFQMCSNRQVMVLCILFVAIGIMYVRGNMFHMNPTLLLLGFRLYDVKFEGEGHMTQTVICRDFLHEDDSLKIRNINDNISLGKKL